MLPVVTRVPYSCFLFIMYQCWIHTGGGGGERGGGG